jgi:hypothetical protein
MFEEPIKDTHFFLVVPDVNALLKTLISRFYLISARKDLAEESKEAEKFIAMSLQSRLDFIKELLLEAEEEDEEGNEIVALDSTRSKALKFLNVLEFILHQKVFTGKNSLKNSSGLTLPGVPVGSHTVLNSSENFFLHLFKVREFLRMPGSSTKNLMESVALIVPNLSN